MIDFRKINASVQMNSINSDYSPIVTNGLLVNLDISNKLSMPQTGSTIFDLSGNNNNFTLFNSPTFDGTTILFNGTNQYARSINSLNLSQFTSVTVEIDLRIVNANIGMAWEHTSDWNTNAGGMGLYNYSGGGAYVLDSHHTNHNTQSSVNYGASVGSNWAVHTNIFSRILDPTGRLCYVNGSQAPLLSGSSSTNAGAVFANAPMFIGSRNGTGAFGNHQIGGFRVYGRKLTDAEIRQNFLAVRQKYRI